MKKWLIMNEEEDVRVGLAPRYDLTEKGAYAFGLTDCKVISPETSQDNFLWAISGPTQSGGRFPPFSWENWPNVPHSGMPIKWDFDWVKFPIDNEKSTEEPILE